MASTLNMDPGATTEALLEELRSRGRLKPASLAELGHLLADLRRLESKMVRTQHTRVSVAELKRWHGATLRLLSDMGHGSGRSA
jgi:hypothetical protein